jgi:hypothetical protein
MKGNSQKLSSLSDIEIFWQHSKQLSFNTGPENLQQTLISRNRNKVTELGGHN